MFAFRAGKLCNRPYMAGNFVTGAKSGKACQQQGRENIRALRAGKCHKSMARRAQDQVFAMLLITQILKFALKFYF